MRAQVAPRTERYRDESTAGSMRRAMAQRANKGISLGAVLLFVAWFIAVPLVLTFAVYGGILCIFIGLLIFEFVTPEKPGTSKATQFYSAEDCSALDSLKASQEKLPQRKARIYSEAGRLGLVPRSLDRTRFDERKSVAKRINSKLDDLDEEFADVVAQIDALKSAVHGRRQEWSDEFREWRCYSSARLAFRVAVMSYISIGFTFLLLTPAWLQSFSATVSSYVWFHLTSVTPAYGTAVIAFGAAAAIATPAGLFVFRQMSAALPGDDEFRRRWASDHGDALDNFRRLYWTTESEDDEEESEFADSDHGWDGETDGQAALEDVQERPWFEVLGVSPDASFDEVKAAKRKLAWAYHSDRLSSVEGLHADFSKLAVDKMTEINLAYEEAERICKSRPLATGRK